MRVIAGDPQATPTSPRGSSDLDALASAVARVLLRDGKLAEQLVRAAERVSASGQRQTPGQLLPGTVSTLSGALIAGPPMRAMVYLGGATHAVACYVAPHVQCDVAPGQDVWVEPVNGSRADLWIVGIRAFSGTPLAQQALTNATAAQATANAALPKAGGTLTGGIVVPAPPTLAGGVQLSGQFGVETNDSAVGSGTVGAAINFPLTCTNVPTGVSLSVRISARIGAPTARQITRTGFEWTAPVTGTGDIYVYGTWQTVGQ